MSHQSVSRVGLDVLPAAWRSDRLVASERERLRGARVFGDDRALVTLSDTDEGPSVAGYGQGAAQLVAELFDAGEIGGRLRWVDLPRGPRLDERVSAALRLEALPGWDWMWTDLLPDQPADRVVRLDPVADAVAIRDCLAEANPDTWRTPGAPDDLGWWGVTAADGLAGVIGVTARGGHAPDGVSWHLHGLGVRPAARGRGLGTALTAAVTRLGLAEGADWASLGVWASNGPAIGIYHRLGYRTGHRRGSYRQLDEPGAPCNA